MEVAAAFRPSLSVFVAADNTKSDRALAAPGEGAKGVAGAEGDSKDGDVKSASPKSEAKASEAGATGSTEDEKKLTVGWLLFLFLSSLCPSSPSSSVCRATRWRT